jgi:hypothetical protein
MEETRDALLKTGQYFSSPGPVPTVDPLTCETGERLKQGQTPLSDIANLPDLDYSHPSDAVFKAVAIVPMSGLAIGGPPREGFPVDLTEFTRLISG